MNYAMFLPNGPHGETIAWARAIEAAGFSSLWQGEIVNSALVPLAAIAPAVDRIVLGAGVALAFTHSPVMLTFAALDLDYLTGGRFVLGLGVAHPNRNNNWYAGHDAGKPVSQLREYVEVARLIMERSPAGGQIEYEGTYYRIRARAFLPRPVRQPRARVPIYIAAVKPGMSALAGEVAEGLIGNPMFSARHVSDVVLPAVRVGLARAGRERTSLEILGQCFAVIEDDLATAYRIGAGALLFSVWARIYDEIFANHGFADVVERVRALRAGGQEGNSARAIEAIPREMVDAFCAVGPIDRVRARVAERRGLLDTVILAVPTTATTREQQDHYRRRLLEAFAS